MIKKIFKYLILNLILVGTLLCNQNNSQGFLGNIKELKEISDIMDILKENHVGDKIIDRKVLMQGGLKGMIESLEEPSSIYIPNSDNNTKNEKIYGIGVAIVKKRNEAIEIISVLDDSPAAKIGLKPKDLILMINGESTINLSIEESIKKLNKSEQKKLKLLIFREMAKATKEFVVIPDVLPQTTEKYEIIDKTNKIGYLRISRISDNTTDNIKKYLEELKKDKVETLILDLRNVATENHKEGVKITSLFVKAEILGTLKPKSGDKKIITRSEKYYKNFSLIILINRGTYATAEYIAGTIKEAKEGVLVGEKTYGQGKYHTIINLSNGDVILFSVADYYTIGDKKISGDGIIPNFTVTNKQDNSFDAKDTKDLQLEAAILKAKELKNK